MLAKKYRLPIQEVLKVRAISVTQSPYFSLKKFSSGKPYGRAGIVVSKKVFPLAAKRNWLRRIALDTAGSRLSPSKDLLLIAKPAVSALTSKDAIIEELRKII